MTRDPVRQAGSGRRSDGATVTWTIADGRRGRRWREVVVVGDAVAHSLLYETGPDRRFRHLELAAPGGLVTLHPEPDGSLHGNVVRATGGVEHVRGIALAPGGMIHVQGSSITAAAIDWARGGEAVEILVLDPGSLRLRAVRSPADRPLDAAGDGGIPLLSAAETWPLEA